MSVSETCRLTGLVYYACWFCILRKHQWDDEIHMKFMKPKCVIIWLFPFCMILNELCLKVCRCENCHQVDLWTRRGHLPIRTGWPSNIFKHPQIFPNNSQLQKPGFPSTWAIYIHLLHQSWRNWYAIWALKEMGCARLFSGWWVNVLLSSVLEVFGGLLFHNNWNSKVIFLTYSLLVQTGQRREVSQITTCATIFFNRPPETFSIQNCWKQCIFESGLSLHAKQPRGQLIVSS